VPLWQPASVFLNACVILCVLRRINTVSQSDYAITTTTIYHDSVLVGGGRIDRNLIAPDAGAHTRRRATFATSLRARWSARQARVNNVSAQLSTFCRTHDFLTPVSASPACSNSTLPNRARSAGTSSAPKTGRCSIKRWCIKLWDITSPGSVRVAR